jgi:hypothetical protein
VLTTTTFGIVVTYLRQNDGERDDESVVHAGVDCNTMCQQTEEHIQQSRRRTVDPSKGSAAAGDSVLASEEAVRVDDEVGISVTAAGEVHVDFAAAEQRSLDGDEE